jgi:predicted Zn-dependent protease
MKHNARHFWALMLTVLLAVPTLTFADDDDKKKKKLKDKEDVSKIGQRDIDGKINLVSLEREIAMGKQYAQQIEQTARLVEDAAINEYVDRLAQNIVRNSDAKVPFTVRVIDSDAINAFAIPGGFFYINTGLILAADEEAELAGVMAHEIAHVTARHSTRQMTKAQIIQWAMIPLLIFGPGGWAGYGIYQGLSYGLPITMLKFTRNAEREADFLGLQYMYASGYDPTSFVSFFEKLREKEAKSPGSIPKIFSSHPPTEERVAKAQEEIAELLPARDEYVVTSSEFDGIKQRLSVMLAGRKLEEEDDNRPTLRRKKRDKKDGEEEEKDDEPPVLRRRN